MRAVELFHLTYGCVFLALNTAVALAPGWLLSRRFRGHPAAVAVGATLGGVGSFLFGGTWYVLLPRLWEPPPPPDYNPWGWFVLAGGFSVGYAAAGCVAIAVAAAIRSGLRRLRARHAEPGAAADTRRRGGSP